MSELYPSSRKWKDLQPEKPLLEALRKVGERPPDTAGQNAKKNWSKFFADACAMMFAAALRQQPAFSRFEVFPTSKGEKSEYLTGARGRGRGKKVDVAVSNISAGLQVALSLKAGNFIDVIL